MLSGFIVLYINFSLSYQVLLPFYAGITVTFGSSLLSQYVYWKYRSASEEMCLQEALGSCWKPGIWLPALVDTFVSIIILSVRHDRFEAKILIFIVVLVQFLMVATKRWIFIELKYIVSRIMLVWVSLVVYAVYTSKEKNNIVKQLNETFEKLNDRQQMDETNLIYLLEKSNTLELKLKDFNSDEYSNRFSINTFLISKSAFVAFTLLFICSKFIFNIATHTRPDIIQLWQWLVTVIEEYCFNPIIMLGIYWFLCNLAVLLGLPYYIGIVFFVLCVPVRAILSWCAFVSFHILMIYYNNKSYKIWSSFNQVLFKNLHGFSCCQNTLLKKHRIHVLH